MLVLENKKWSFRCLAGNSFAIINHDGAVSLCELNVPVGNLRKEDYNFMKIWNNKKANQQRKMIKKHKCDCTHTCFLSGTIDHSPLVVFLKMPLNLLFRKW